MADFDLIKVGKLKLMLILLTLDCLKCHASSTELHQKHSLGDPSDTTLV